MLLTYGKRINLTKYDQELERIEIDLILEGINRYYGYDFRDYDYEMLKRRILSFMRVEKLKTYSSLQEKVLHDRNCMYRFLNSLVISVTAMFRNPAFFHSLRDLALPYLRCLPFIRIWHAGCATGEEVYSMAILLKEEELYERSIIYATDISEQALRKAKEGVIPLQLMQEYTKNYHMSGGKHSFSDYYTANQNKAIITHSLRKNIIWAQHNLVSEASFNEFHLILCQNVMIYFNKSLQERVQQLLYESLAHSGFLGLGKAESIRSTPLEKCYKVMDVHGKLFRKVDEIG
ncbi:MAG TPA: protein-glutamate O-methyltransferase CheR [Desulfitobacteriaceae bacterium]|jgi:chemotaxis protein methyltransferase CheR|nr:protein-glutamate O-methyltransferase CheR [Desulfitobacteriaceae bacterium]